MFGAICAGRLVQTNLEQVDTNKFLFQLYEAEQINHITVFLLPDNPLPDGYGATVYFSWPGRPFQLLGGLSNAKPSAIFKLGGAQQSLGQQNVVASLGLSIEPLQVVEAQLSTISKSTNTVNSTALGLPTPNATVLTSRIVTNLYNFLTGYTVDSSKIVPTEQFVPLRAFQEWHAKFMKKIQFDSSFLERDQE